MSRTPCLIPREDSAIDTRDKVKYIFYNFKIFNLIYLIFSTNLSCKRAGLNKIYPLTELASDLTRGTNRTYTEPINLC